MTSLAEQLMAGPRGRELCLLAACLAEENVSQASRVVEARLESGIAGGWYAPGGIRSEPGSEDSVRVLAAALTGVDEIDDHWIRLALESTVDGAMYWQEPWSIQASLPELAVELQRIAGIVAGTSAARWWSAPVSCDQHQVRFLPFDEVAAIDAPAETILADAYRPRDVGRPPGYLTAWWSVPPFGLVRTCSAPADEPSSLYLVEDGYGQTEASVHRANFGNPPAFEIDSGEAWAQLCRSHPFDATESKDRDWYTTTGLADTRWVMPDWSAVAREYDAVHLQVGAYLAASGTAIEVEPGVHSVIAGWAPGDTYWLTDVVEVDPVGRIFVKDQDDDLWHPTEETA